MPGHVCKAGIRTLCIIIITKQPSIACKNDDFAVCKVFLRHSYVEPITDYIKRIKQHYSDVCSFADTDVGSSPASSRGHIRDTGDKHQDMTFSALSRSSEDVSLSDEPPPLPTSPVPSELVRSPVGDLEEVQVSAILQ